MFEFISDGPTRGSKFLKNARNQSAEASAEAEESGREEAILAEGFRGRVPRKGSLFHRKSSSRNFEQSKVYLQICPTFWPQGPPPVLAMPPSQPPYYNRCSPTGILKPNPSKLETPEQQL